MKSLRKICAIAMAAAVLTLCLSLLVACGNKIKPCEEHTWQEVSNSATCTEGGVLNRKCTVCGISENVEVPALGHDWDMENATIDVPATCTKTGEGQRTCKRCLISAKYTIDMVPHSLRSDWDDPRYKPATCTKDGFDPKICRVCQQKFEVVTPALGHDFTGKTVIVAEPTCEEDGSSYILCQRQDCDGDSNGNIPAKLETTLTKLGHAWQSESVIDQKPTFDAEGSRAVHCDRCDSVKDRQSVPKLVENQPVEYRFRVVRSNREIVKPTLSAIKITIKDANGSVVTESNSRNYFDNGEMRVSLLPKNYTVEVAGLPAGYSAEQSYPIEPGDIEADLTVKASLLPASAINPNIKYQVGSVMHDYTFNDVSDRTVTLSELLSENKMVLLNFFFIKCGACQSEMPGLLNAYNLYKDDMKIVMLDVRPAAEDTPDKIKDEWVDGFGVPDSIYVANDLDVTDICEKFGFDSAPQNVVVDKDGVVLYAEGGATNQNKFISIFDKYTKYPYVPKDEEPAQSVPTQYAHLYEIEVPSKFEF